MKQNISTIRRKTKGLPGILPSKAKGKEGDMGGEQTGNQAVCVHDGNLGGGKDTLKKNRRAWNQLVPAAKAVHPEKECELP